MFPWLWPLHIYHTEEKTVMKSNVVYKQTVSDILPCSVNILPICLTLNSSWASSLWFLLNECNFFSNYTITHRIIFISFGCSFHSGQKSDYITADKEIWLIKMIFFLLFTCVVGCLRRTLLPRVYVWCLGGKWASGTRVWKGSSSV